jgi:hypothetical protein
MQESISGLKIKNNYENCHHGQEEARPMPKQYLTLEASASALETHTLYTWIYIRIYIHAQESLHTNSKPAYTSIHCKLKRIECWQHK